jgi:hypothetical protein
MPGMVIIQCMIEAGIHLIRTVEKILDIKVHWVDLLWEG